VYLSILGVKNILTGIVHCLILSIDKCIGVYYMSTNELQAYVAKTRAYLASPRGREHVEANKRRGYDGWQRRFVAVQTATRLRDAGRIAEVAGKLA